MDSIANNVAISSSKTRGQIERCEHREQIRPPNCDAHVGPVVYGLRLESVRDAQIPPAQTDIKTKL